MFVDEIGLDGNYYISLNNCPVVFGNILGSGAFYTAESKKLKKYLDKLQIDNQLKTYLYNRGLIVMNSSYQKSEANADFLVALIHEQFHSNRMLLINSLYTKNKNINAAFHNGISFVKHDNNSNAYCADASQDILKGSIDNSKNTIEKYKRMTDSEKENISFKDSKYSEKMMHQQLIDEALIETMAIVAYKLWHNKLHNKRQSVMEIIADLNSRYKSDDIIALTSIILRHNNLDLFYWTLDPLTYQNNDINYDFFKYYINSNDIEDVKKLVQTDDINFDELANQASKNFHK